MTQPALPVSAVPSRPTPWPERALVAVLGLTVADTLYLSWRYLALHAGRVVPGTGLCSWSAGVDCDVVLRTPEARAFWVPNALLGLGFFAGCLLWWVRGVARYGDEYRRLLALLLAVWLGVGTLFTLRFFQLLVRLPALCPFCPWNHLWTWTSFGLAVAVYRRTPRPAVAPPFAALAPHIALCVGQFFALLGLWGAAVALGWLPLRV